MHARKHSLVHNCLIRIIEKQLCKTKYKCFFLSEKQLNSTEESMTKQMTYRMTNSGSSLILAAKSRVEAGRVGLKMEPGKRPVWAHGPLSCSSYCWVICLSIGRPSRYSSLDTWPPGPWYIQSKRSSFFLRVNTCLLNWGIYCARNDHEPFFQKFRGPLTKTDTSISVP